MSYKVSLEELEDVLKETNKKLRSVTKVDDIVTGLVNGQPVKTYCLAVKNLKDLLETIRSFGQELIDSIDKNKVLYIRQEIEVILNDTSYMCPNTFDYIEKPTEGYWIIYCRLYQEDNDICKRLFKKEGATK